MLCCSYNNWLLFGDSIPKGTCFHIVNTELDLHVLVFFSSKVHGTLAINVLCSGIESFFQQDFHGKMIALSSSNMQWCVSILYCTVSQFLSPGFVVDQKLQG